MKLSKEANIVVVPDGLAFDNINNRPLNEPSFVYRKVLDQIVEIWGGQNIYLAPANHFGNELSEQEVAESYLDARGVALICTPIFKTPPYIDTWGNAHMLKQYLENHGIWPLSSIILVVSSIHARRAIFVFGKNGFAIDQVISVPYDIPTNAAIVPRLWYYRFPIIHQIYEILALGRDIVRSFFK